MTVNIDDLKGYLKIDKYALDDEIVNQPSLLHKVSEAYVTAAAARDALKEQLASTDADIASKFRKKFADSKYTEGQVKEYVQTHIDHSNANADYLDAKEWADQLSVLKDAFQQRGYMLRDLVQLHTANYFEASSVRSTPDQDRMIFEQRKMKLAHARFKRSTATK